MRRLAATLILGIGGLLLTPGAGSAPAVPGDPTPPVVTPVITGTPGDNGWYTSNVTVNWLIEDPESIILETSGCDTQTFTADTAGTTLTCSARSDGGTTTVSITFNIDQTPPSANVTPSRSADANGWYNHTLTVTFAGSDAMSGLDSCTPSASYSGPDGANASVSGSCRDKAGNTTPTSLAFDYDATAPSNLGGSPSHRPNKNDWYNHALTVTFQGNDATSGVAGCTQATYDGPDDPSVALSGSCEDRAGNQSGSKDFIVRYDETAPSNDGGSPSREPDEDAWYNHPLTITFQGSDATSGIDACTQVTYSGPNTGDASVPGFCRDKAGNQSGSNRVRFKYDGTPPTLVSLKVKAGNRRASLTWKASPDTSLVEIVRTAGTRSAGVRVYRGNGRTFTDKGLENGVRYRYSLTGYDKARNAATRDVVATPTAPLLSPQADARVSAPPQLVWKPADKATYYNVQVWRRGQIFSAWPTGPSVQLTRTWIYAGRRQRLTPGRYRWYVWAGYGRRAQNKFGPLLGSSSFVVAAR